MSTEETRIARLWHLTQLVDEVKAVFNSAATGAGVDLQDTDEADNRRRHIVKTLPDAKRYEIANRLIEIVDILDDEAQEEEFYPDALVELEHITTHVCQIRSGPESVERTTLASEPDESITLVPDPVESTALMLEPTESIALTPEPDKSAAPTDLDKKNAPKDQHKKHLLEWVQMQIPPITITNEITPWPTINHVGRRTIYFVRSPHGLQQALNMMNTATRLGVTAEIREAMSRAWSFQINRDGNAADDLMVWISAYQMLSSTTKGPSILSRLCTIGIYRSMQRLREESGRQRLSTASMDEYAKLSGVSKSIFSNLGSLGNRFDQMCNGHIGLVPFLPLVGDRDMAQLKHKQCFDIGRFMDDEWARAMCRLGQQIEAPVMGTGEAPACMRVLYESRDDLCNLGDDDLLPMLEPWIGKGCNCVSYAALGGEQV